MTVISSLHWEITMTVNQYIRTSSQNGMCNITETWIRLIFFVNCHVETMWTVRVAFGLRWFCILVTFDVISAFMKWNPQATLYNSMHYKYEKRKRIFIIFILQELKKEMHPIVMVYAVQANKIVERIGNFTSKRIYQKEENFRFHIMISCIENCPYLEMCNLHHHSFKNKTKNKADRNDRCFSNVFDKFETNGHFEFCLKQMWI